MKKLWHIYDRMRDIVCILNADTQEIVYMNPHGLRMLGFRSLEELRKDFRSETLQNLDGLITACGQEETPDGGPDEKLWKNMVDGLVYAVRSGFFEVGGERFRIQTASECREEELHEYQSSFGRFLRKYYFDTEMFFHSVSAREMPVYVFFGDVQEDVYYVSDKLREELGLSSNLVHQLFRQAEPFVYEKDRENYKRGLLSVMEERREFYSQRLRFQGMDKRIRWMCCWGIIKWDGDRPLFFSGCMTDLEDEFSADSVTGFLRYPAAVRRLTALSEEKEQATVFGIGLSRFSVINDSLGRMEADRLLRQICAQLRERLYGFELYRMDGVRFLAVCPGQVPDVRISGIIRQCIQECYRKKGIEMKNPCALGMLRCPEDGRSGMELIERVMTCIYYAKRNPEQGVLRFSWDMLEKRQKEAEMSLELCRNVRDQFKGFRVVIQPIVEGETGRIKGGEILSRWECRGTAVSPECFIMLMEENKQILAFGKWVFEQAVLACRSFMKERPDFTVSFNVSYLQITDSSFLPFMKETLSRYGVSGKNLILELTETHFDEAPEHLERLVKECRAMGMKLALDDFGKGYSNLQMLLRYPVDLVKLDREIMREIAQSRTSRELVKSIVLACHRADKKVCVEGVETETELGIVKRMKADYVQGYYFYRPLNTQELLTKISGA